MTDPDTKAVGELAASLGAPVITLDDAFGADAVLLDAGAAQLFDSPEDLLLHYGRSLFSG